VVNSTWRVWNKSGVPQTPVMTLGSIFNSLPVGNLCRGNDGDPIVLYVNEQATFAPDNTNRWMGSAAMDHEGNLAVGYIVSSTTVFSGIRYAGRLAGDPPNGLAQGEAVLQAGGFVQTNTSSRWGDYSNMVVDPIDDCTFWVHAGVLPG